MVLGSLFLKFRLNRTDKELKTAESWKDAGFSLVELLVVLAIIGMIAALATPRVLRYLGSSQVSTSKTQMKNVANALELFFIDAGKYPTSEEGLKALIEAPAGAIGWGGPYLKQESAIQDAWGNPFHYELDGSVAFSLKSLGRDGKTGGEGPDADFSL